MHAWCIFFFVIPDTDDLFFFLSLPGFIIQLSLCFLLLHWKLRAGLGLYMAHTCVCVADVFSEYHIIP